jgi:hypothetical protein
MNKALLVGINKYPAQPLCGCVNDVEEMASYIKTARGFKNSDIRILADKNATTAAIKGELRKLVKNVSTGDRILFHYSGHGATMPTKDKTIVDAICPVDFDATPQHAITSLDFAGLFAGIPDGVEFNWLSDSCHSGDLTRVMLGPNHKARMWVLHPATEAKIQKILDMPNPRVLRMHSATSSNVGFISGCGSAETSADAYFHGKYNGAFTHFLLKCLKGKSDTSLVNLTSSVVAALHANGYGQTPCVHGGHRVVSEPFLYKQNRSAREIIRPVDHARARRA